MVLNFLICVISKFKKSQNFIKFFQKQKFNHKKVVKKKDLHFAGLFNVCKIFKLRFNLEAK